MEASLIVAGLSLIVSMTAVLVASIQVRRTDAVGSDANAVDVSTQLFSEFRSAEFQKHIDVVFSVPPPPAANGFGGELDDETANQWRKHALSVTYFFQYLGMLVANDLVDEAIVIDAVSNTATKSWLILAPFVRAERDRRTRFAEVYRSLTGQAQSTGFASHFEHLVRIMTDEDGKLRDIAIHNDQKLRTMPVSDAPPLPAPSLPM